MAQFDPSEKGVEDVQKHLKSADPVERDRVLHAELAGKKRKTILEPYGFDADARYDGTGRKLYPWEVDAKDLADAGRVVEETEEQRVAREAQLELDSSVGSTPQLGSNAGPGSTTAAGAPSTGSTSTASTGTSTGTSTGAGTA